MSWTNVFGQFVLVTASLLPRTGSVWLFSRSWMRLDVRRQERSVERHSGAGEGLDVA